MYHCIYARVLRCQRLSFLQICVCVHSSNTHTHTHTITTLELLVFFFLMTTFKMCIAMFYFVIYSNSATQADVMTSDIENIECDKESVCVCVRACVCGWVVLRW